MSNHSIDPCDLKPLQDIQRIADALGIPLMAVGASARVLVFDKQYNISPHRMTLDWDFGVRVETWDAYNDFRRHALGNGNGPFDPDPCQAHRIIHRQTQLKVDLVPFGGLENDGLIAWPESDSQMNVIGFDDAYENSTTIELGPDLQMTIATPPLLFALKLFAFADRRTDRDIIDIWHMLAQYPAAGREGEIYDEPLIALLNGDKDEEVWRFMNSVALGSDVGRACKQETLRRLLTIIEDLVDPYHPRIIPIITPVIDQGDEEQKRNNVAAHFRWIKKTIQLFARSQQ